MKVPQLKISAWYILILCLIGTFLSSQGLSMYGIVHWRILTSSYKLKSHIKRVSEDKEVSKLIDNNKNLKQLFDDLPTISEKLHTSGWDLMGYAGRLRLFGLLAVLLSFFAFFCRPRWIGFIALPFGLYSLKLSMVLM